MSVAKETSNYQASTIQSNAKSDTQPRLGFRSWRYATMKMNTGQSLTDVCVDTGCGASLTDRKFLAQEVPDYTAHARQCAKPPKVRGIGDAVVATTTYIPLAFRVPDVAADGNKMYILPSLQAFAYSDYPLLCSTLPRLFTTEQWKSVGYLDPRCGIPL